MIRAFPDICFAIISIGSRQEDHDKSVYVIPNNMVRPGCHYLYNFPPSSLVQASGDGATAFEHSRKLHDVPCDPTNREETADLIRVSIANLRDDGPLAGEQFLYSHRVWDMAMDYYRRCCTNPSFADYFRIVHIMYRPL